MSKNLFESLQTVASAAHSPISCSGYGEQSDSGDLVINEETQNDEEEDDLLDLVLEIDENKGNYDSGDCTKSANSDSANIGPRERKPATDSVNELALIRGTVRNESDFCPSILMNECSTSPLLSSQDVISSSDSSSRSLDKNIWKQLAGKSMLPQVSLPLPENDDGDKHSFRSATMEIISETGPPYLSPMQNSLSERNQLDISKPFSDSRSNKSGTEHATYIQRKEVKVGPLVECISEKQPITEQSAEHKESLAESMRSRVDRKTDDSYSIESGEILSSEDGDSEDDGTKELLIDEDAGEGENSDVFGNENEERAEETEDTEWCSETTQPLSEDSDEDTERASIDSELNNLIIAFPDPSEQSPQDIKDDNEASCPIASPDPLEESPQHIMDDNEASCSIASPDPLEESPQHIMDDNEASCPIASPDPSEESPQKDFTETSCIQEEIQERVETYSDEKEDAGDSVEEIEAARSIVKQPEDSGVRNDKESETIKVEPSDEEVSIVEDEVKEVCDLTESPTVVKKEELPRPSNRQVSFFEKAADLLCLNLFDNSDVYLSSPPKSVFSSFVKTEVISEDDPSDESKKNHEVSVKSDETSNNIESKVAEVSKSPKSLDVPQASLLYDSCSVNELLLKEEEEEEDEEEREGQETVVDKTENGPGSSQEGLCVLSNIVDRLASGKEEDSRLSLISKRLRNRMPHWDDSFNEAFVPQIRSKPSTTSGSTSSSSGNHNSSDSYKRSKTSNQSNDMQFKSVSHETYRDPITFVPQHVKKVRQFLTALNVCQEKVEDTFEEEPSEEAIEHSLSSLKMGSPNPKSTALRARKHSYHDSKKALRLPQKLIRSLPSPTVANSEDDASEPVAPGPSTPSTSMEFRSSLGASVRTKPRAFTKAALRRQIIEEASTAKPQFRVKTRPTSDDGTGALAIVITRVTRPPHAKRSLSSDPRAETDSHEKTGETGEKLKTMSGECSRGSVSYSIDARQDSNGEGIGDGDVEIERKKNESGKNSEGLNTTTRNSSEKRKLGESLPKSNETSKTTCSTDAHDVALKRRRRDSDSSATSSSRDRNTPINFASSSYQSSAKASSQSPPKNVSSKNVAQNMNNPDDAQSQSFDEDASCRNAVNFRGVASNRKRLKGQKKPRLLQEIENTSGFLMDQSKTDAREQRALERLLQQNAELHSGNNSDKQADSSVQSSPRVLLDRLSPEQIKRKGKIRSKRRRDFSQRDARRDYKNPNPDNDQRKMKNAVNVAAANRITAKYAAAKIDRARGGTSSTRELASIHPRVRTLIRRTSGRDVYGRTALHLAAALGQLESVMYCLKLNIDLNEHDHSGLYPIHAASRNGNVAVIKALLEAGADVNMCAGADGISPLHEAASGGKIDAVKELVARGADRTLAMYDGTTPTDCAVNEDIRCFLEGNNESANTSLSEVVESALMADEDKFELYDRNPPLVFTLWLETTKKKSEVLLLSELCDFCGLDKVNIRIHKPFVHIVKVSMQQLHQGMRNSFLWPALRLRLRIEGSLQEHKSFENPSRNLIALVLYTAEIRTLTGGIGISLSKEEIERVKDPPTPPKLVCNRQPMMQKEKVNVAVERRGGPVSTNVDIVKKETCVKPLPIIKADSKPSPPKIPPAKPVVSDRKPHISLNLHLDDSGDSDGSSTDEDVVITGIFSAPKRPPTLSCERKYTPKSSVPLPRKRPVASVIPNCIQPQMKSRRLSHESDSDHDRLQLREEYLRDYEQIKIERRNLEKKELQLKERIMEMNESRKHRARVPSDDKSRDPPRTQLTHDTSEDGRRFPVSSQSTQRPRLSATLIPMSSVSLRPTLKDLARSQSSEIPEGSVSSPLQRVMPTAVSSRPPVMSPDTTYHMSKANPVACNPLMSKRGHLGGIRMPLQKPVERPCLTITSASPFSATAPGNRVTRYPQPSALRSKIIPSLSKFDHVYTSSVPSMVHPASLGKPASEDVFTTNAQSVVRPASLGRPSPEDVLTTNAQSMVRPPSLGRPASEDVLTTNAQSMVRPASLGRPASEDVLTTNAQSMVRPASLGRPSPDVVNRHSIPRFIPMSVTNSSVIVTPQFVTRVRPSNPNLLPSAVLSAPTLDIPETPGNCCASMSDLPCSPPGSPPLLVPQGPVAVQNTTSRVSPVPNSAPPLLFPQEPPVLLPCPKIADTTYPINNSRVEMHAMSERDETPPLLIPSKPPPIRGVKCASELLKKRSSKEVPNKSNPNTGIPTPRVSEVPKKSVTVTSPDMNRYDPPPSNDSSPIPLKKTSSDAGCENDNVLDKSRIRLNLPPPILTSPEKCRFDVPSEKCVTVKCLGDTVTHSLQSNQLVESSPQLNKLISIPAEEKQNLPSKTGVLKLNSDRRKKLPLISFHGDGQTISVCKRARRGNEIQSFNLKCIDLTGLSPPGTPVVE